MSDVAQPLTKIKRLNKIISQHEGKITNLVPILQDVQAEYRYLPEEALSYVANALDVPPALVFGVSTFYSQFTMEPRGRYVIKVCDGTACHVRGSEKINFAIREAAGLGGTDAPTTSDLKFTVERVACVGACGLAPVVMVNDREVYGNLTQSEATQLVERLEKQDSSTDIDSPVIYDTEIGVVPEKKHFMQNHADLERAIGSFRAGIMAQKVRILVCMETACIANGAREVYAALRESLDARGLRAELGILSESIDTPADISGELNFAHNMPQPAGSGEAGLAKAGCHGYCQLAPLVVLEPGRIVYARVKPEDVPEIITRTVEQGEIISRLLNHEPGEEAPTLDELGMDFYRFQHKIALATCGRIDSEDIREYLAFGGYSALGKALAKQTPEEVLSAVNAAGLRGRGGGGFKTGIKWDACRRAPGDVKYVVCNADEGDPGAFMDRSLLEGDPHRVIEGIALCAYAIGAQEAYIYARAEYPLAVKRVKRALNEAMAYGLLGKNILGSDFSLKIKIKEGAGAFVCGEETALLASIEGQRGMPRPRPPFPASSGLWGRPTIINNVETLACVPFIVKEGPDAFKQFGTELSPGTKTFALAGQVTRTGLVEVPMGITLRRLIFDIGGGVRGTKPFKAAQIGGPSGGCLTTEHLDMPLDFESLRSAGAMVGSGGLVVVDQGTCMVEMAHFFMSFVQEESCGKCVPCREGTKRMLQLLRRMIRGRAGIEDLIELEHLAPVVAESSLCGLGKTAPNPVLTTLRYFRDEYMAHVLEKKCPAGACQDLLDYLIDAELCNGCGACIKVCPTGAITGQRKQPHVIDPKLCTRCGECIPRCKQKAVRISDIMVEV